MLPPNAGLKAKVDYWSQNANPYQTQELAETYQQEFTKMLDTTTAVQKGK